MVCCGADTTVTSSSMVLVCGVDDCSEKNSFSTSCMVSVAHAFFNGMGAGSLLTCLVVGISGAGVCEVFALFSASSFFGQSRLVVACPSLQFTHFSVQFLLSLHWLNVCHPAQYLQVWNSDLQVLVWWTNFWQLKHCNGSLTNGLIRKLPYPLVNLTGCCFATSTTFTIFVVSDFCFSEFHFVIWEASSTSLSCCSSSSVTQDGTPIMIHAFRV